MPVYKINDQELHVIEAGHPNRQVALLIHGWSSSWYAMSPLITLLSQRFRCLAVDLPGYGNSPKFEDRTTIDKYVDILADLIEQVSDGPVVLVGHSMGGMTSLSLAEKYPMLVERMVLICPTITGKLSTYINLIVSPITFLDRLGLAHLASLNLIQGFVSRITDRIMRPASFAQRTGINEQDYLRLREDARRPDQGIVRAECFRAMRDNNLSGRLTKVDIPSLVIWGAEDNTVPLRDSGVVVDEWPEADLRILPKAGHWPHFERPEITRKMIAAFLGLPLVRGELRESDDGEQLQIRETAQFLAHSEVGSDLNLTQRTRLAAQCHRHVYEPGETIVHIRDPGSEMFIIQDGTVEVWSDPDNPGEWTADFKKVATLRPGQMTGELALFDEGLRTADLIAGDTGAIVLAIDRETVRDMSEADPTLGTRFLWNMARAMSNRVRFIQWQFRRARKRDEEVIRTATLDRQEIMRRLEEEEQAQQLNR